MRFLLDVNVGKRIAQALIAAGHDVVRAALIDATAEDPDILAQAVDNRRVLITCDREFGELIFAHSARQPPAIIYLRYQARDVDEAVARLMPILDFDLLKDHMTVIDERRVRRTPFPARSNDNG